MRLLVFAFILCNGSFLRGQYFEDHEIQLDQLSEWETDSLTTYAGTYFFGFAEGDDELRIIVTPNSVLAQRIISRFNKEGDFHSEFLNFTHVKIVGPQFFSDQTHGTFMILRENGSIRHGLFLESPWTEGFNNGGEFGSRLPDETPHFAGKYPEGSSRYLHQKELEHLKPEELQIFRNEIFARYGYTFQKGGQMEAYFSNIPWYISMGTDVTPILTEIEKHNIELIREVEKEKRTK